MSIPGPAELILLLVIVLIILGPGRVPEIGNALGRGMREFRKASADFEESMRGEAEKQPAADDSRTAPGPTESH
jgi:sec-independent protein translocase protein TatA